MNKTIKTCLTLLLITSLAILPMRAAFAMDANMAVDMSSANSEHCKDMNMDMSLHDMSSMNTDENSTQNNNGDCCDNCDSNCNHCISTVSFIETDSIPTLNHSSDTFYRFSVTSVFTRELTPLLRPPLLHFI